MQLLNIFNTMGSGVAVPEQEVAPIMQKLQDNGIVCKNEITDVMNAIEASLTDTEAFSAAVVTRAMSPQLAVKEDGGIGSNRAIIRQIYSLMDLMDSEGFDEHVLRNIEKLPMTYCYKKSMIEFAKADRKLVHLADKFILRLALKKLSSP
ncbi:unnamed protein product [Soboliphyme baturini]|uniref:Centrin n=1 Tax=Soboliphyme baturini TaxID=241478 RepID=A0A183IMI3_9BILA|nr:unnamed protein product [Soboliphyme baturini]